MATSDAPDKKLERLRSQGVLHRRANDVSDELFLRHDFFDPHDLLQVKYEMLRRVQNEHDSVSSAAEAFGLSRVSYYEIQNAWQRDGLAGLLPKKRGPHQGHKLTDEIILFLLAQRASDPTAGATALAAELKVRFGVHVHTRSIERVLQRGKKNSVEP